MSRQRRYDPGVFTRRQFLRRVGVAGLALPSMSAILAACQNSGETPAASGTSGAANSYGTGGIGGAPYPLARTEAPVTWNIPDDNQPIESDLPPEKDATLKIFNWGYYLKPKIMKDFGEAHDCRVELTTYSDVASAFQKLRSGQVDFDVMFGFTPDYMGKMIAAKLLRPLNKDYIPNFETNVWDLFKSPFYDVQARYTVPYAQSTTGIFWRSDKLDVDIAGMENPYDIFWSPDAPNGKTHLLRSRDPLAMAMMRRGLTDINTEDPAVIQQAHDDVLEVVKAVNPRWDNDDYTDVPQGQAWLHQTWSGNALDAYVFYMVPGLDPGALQYVWPPAVNSEIPGAVGNDMIGVLTTGKNPVLGHMFINQMYEPATALDNFATYTGYQPCLKSISPESIVADGIAPPNLASTVVREEDYANGLQLVELTPEVEALWTDAYEKLKAGV